MNYRSLLVLFLLVTSVRMMAADYYVATTGNDSNSGTSLSAPFASVTKAISAVQAGDVIYLLQGTYAYSAKISLSKSGTADASIQMLAYQSQRVVIDFSGMAVNSSNRGLSLSGSYWHIKGINIHKAGDNGMFISGHYNTIENCVFFANHDTGLQLGNGASNNRIINCDSYGNADPIDYGDADGFACKMDVGDNNYFYGCRAWLNVDDGWDGYLRGADDVNTTLENCWTWMNGYFLDGTDGGASANGNGFKVGGSDDKTLMHNFTLINCVAFDNKSKGFDQNNNKGNMYFHNCTAFRNVGNNYSIPLALNTGKEAEVINCIAIDGKVSLGSFVDAQSNSWNGFSFSTSDFVSIDTTGVSGPRQADGSLPDLDLFKLAQNSSFIDAGMDMGYAYYGDAPDLGAFESDYLGTNVNTAVADALQVELLTNPVQHILRIRCIADNAMGLSVRLISVTGQVQMNVVLPVASGSSVNEINLDGIAGGVYLLVINSDEVSISKKIVKR